MTFEEKKMEYARLIVKAGVHVRKGQTVFIRCAVEHYEFARLVTRYCYEEGAREVIVRYGDTKTARMRYDFAPVEVFRSFPEWDARMEKNQKKDTQHDSGHFDIALELARYVVE